MKRSVISRIVTLLLVICTASGFAGCGNKNVVDEFTVYISVYNGGYGVSWIEDLAAEFNKTQTEYKVEIVAEKSPTVQQEIEQDISMYSAVFSCEPNQQGLIAKDKLVDLTDFLSVKPDGENGLTIRDKIKNYDTWADCQSYGGEGIYGLPYGDSIIGYVFDYDFFVDNLFLNFAMPEDEAELEAQGIKYTRTGEERRPFAYSEATGVCEAGEYITSAGKDGEFGTYDDGQPETEEEYMEMLGKIAGKGMKAYISSGINKDYSNEIIYAIFAQYEGIDGWNTFVDFDSNEKEVTLESGEKTVITIDNGYKVYGMEGLKKAYQFISNTQANSMYMHAACNQLSISHTDAQSLYLLGYRNAADNIQSAMLVDGAWWENEATGTFNFFAENNEPDRAKGKKDYRYMLFPKLSGSPYGLDGNGNGSVFAARDTGSVYIIKNQSDAKIQVTKDFIAYTLTEEALCKFTRETGTMRPYVYNLTESDLAQMTPFARTVYTMYNDSENISIIRPYVDLNSAPVNYATDKGTTYLVSSRFMDGAAYTYTGVLYDGLLKTDYQSFFEGTRDYYDANTWAAYVNQAREAGFYD